MARRSWDEWGTLNFDEEVSSEEEDAAVAHEAKRRAAALAELDAVAASASTSAVLRSQARVAKLRARGRGRGRSSRGGRKVEDLETSAAALAEASRAASASAAQLKSAVEARDAGLASALRGEHAAAARSFAAAALEAAALEAAAAAAADGGGDGEAARVVAARVRLHALLGRGRALMAMGHLASASDTLRDVLRDPSGRALPDAWISRARVVLRMGVPLLAKRHVESARSIAVALGRDADADGTAVAAAAACAALGPLTSNPRALRRALAHADADVAAAVAQHSALSDEGIAALMLEAAQAPPTAELPPLTTPAAADQCDPPPSAAHRLAARGVIMHAEGFCASARLAFRAARQLLASDTAVDGARVAAAAKGSNHLDSACCLAIARCCIKLDRAHALAAAHRAIAIVVRRCARRSGTCAVVAMPADRGDDDAIESVRTGATMAAGAAAVGQALCGAISLRPRVPHALYAEALALRAIALLAQRRCALAVEDLLRARAAAIASVAPPSPSAEAQQLLAAIEHTLHRARGLAAKNAQAIPAATIDAACIRSRAPRVAVLRCSRGAIAALAKDAAPSAVGRALRRALSPLRYAVLFAHRHRACADTAAAEAERDAAFGRALARRGGAVVRCGCALAASLPRANGEDLGPIDAANARLWSWIGQRDRAPRATLLARVVVATGAALGAATAAAAGAPCAALALEEQRNGELREASALCALIEALCAAEGDDLIVALQAEPGRGAAAAAENAGALLLAAPSLFGGWRDFAGASPARAAAGRIALEVRRAPAALLLVPDTDIAHTLAGLADALAPRSGALQLPPSLPSGGDDGLDLSRYILGLESPRRVLELSTGYEK